MTTNRAFQRIRDHAFVHDALLLSFRVSRSLGDSTPTKVVAKYSRDPDEHEFFILTVGTAIAELITHCDHLDYIPLLLSTYRATPAIKVAGFNRHNHIVFHVESYLVRTQSLYDRVLKLVDASFHLLNAPRNCTDRVVLKNVKVERTGVPTVIKRLAKLLEPYARTRNEVIHQHGVKDDQLRLLEMYCLLDDANILKSENEKRDYSEIKRELISIYVREKKQEFLEFNAQLANAIIAVLDSLKKHFEHEESNLRLKLGKEVASS
jgi:Cthe_2314-like HEPN